MKHCKISYKIFQILLSGSLPLTSSCDRFLDIAPPATELASDLVFENNSTANAAITSIYARMATDNAAPYSSVAWLSGLSADEFINYATSTDIASYYTNSLAPANPTIESSLWTPFYNIIYQANAIIEGLNTSTAISENVKKQIIGEAKFVRAFYHFYLTGFFGDIPIITSTDYKVNALLARSTKDMVYKQIIVDLTEAKEQLNSDYVDADGISSTSERLRPNKTTASALLARVYLYSADYQKAESEATIVIEAPQYALPTNLNNVFLNNSTETIWQVQPATTLATTFANKFVLTGTPSSGLDRSVTVSNNILELFTIDDPRFLNWIGRITAAGTEYYFPNKHKVTGNNSTEYNMVMRLAEQYLIRAEARMKQENIKDGLADLNTLRRRANVVEYNIATILQAPLLLVEQERQRELFAEGHRWFDLQRTDRIDEVMTSATIAKGGKWRNGAKLFPIPETERSKNPNLSQNEY